MIKTVRFDGLKTADRLKKFISSQMEMLSDESRQKKLCSLLIGQDKASHLYTEIKKKYAKEVGINFEVIYHDKLSFSEALEVIDSLNNDEMVSGIMVQLPLPGDWEKEQRANLLSHITPSKDIDCLGAHNLGKITLEAHKYLPAAVEAVLAALEAGKIALSGKNVCVIGNSSLVGMPLGVLLSNKGATVTICNRSTRNLEEWTKKADILISATGQADLIKGNMVKEGVVAIDVGSPKGDFDFNSVAAKASFITPVPGGIGPLTVACLMKNFVRAVSDDSSDYSLRL
jgi:methylenetetrahydrofolate dehydrogenase (NADP+)/methenyltetrahydrofolate cyclohydrolase